MTKNESGQGALAIVLILVILGALILGPLLAYMGTGLKAGQMHEDKTQKYYAADAGIEDAMWQIKNDQLSSLFPGYDPYDYSTPYPYTLPNDVNGKNVHITIGNVWIPKELSAPSPNQARSIIEGTENNPPPLIIVGGISGSDPTKYQIGITYSYDSSDPTGQNLKVTTIGIWLPPGFHYEGNCSLASDSDTAPYAVPATPEPYKSGEVVVWSFSSLALYKFPPTTSGFPMVKTFTFSFTGPSGQLPGAALSWIDTTGVSGIDYTWDADKKIYEVDSTATDATGKDLEIEACTVKMETRQLGSSISGDYIAIGNSLLTPTGDVNYRNRLYEGSSATIPTDSIPAGANVEAAYLYWVGWIDYHYWQATSYHGRTTWSWDSTGIPELNYNNYANNLPQLIANAKVNTVSFGGGGTTQDITSNRWQVIESTDAPGEHIWDGTWSYTCFYDATDIVKPLIEEDGVSTFTFGHASHGATSVINVLRPGYPGIPGGTSSDNYYSFTLYNTSDYTGYPLGFPAMKLPSGEWNYQQRYQYAYAGWSLIIIYSTPETNIKHQLYLYDIVNPNFEFKEAWAPGGIPNPDFDGDGSPGGRISGFIVPQPIAGETNAAKMTCFVGEGDQDITGDYFRVNGTSLSDGTSPYNTNNVWNSKSVGLAVPGVDIDTFYVSWSSQILRPGDTWAQVDLPTGNDGFTLVYIILSFRSTVTTGSTISYLIR